MYCTISESGAMKCRPRLHCIKHPAIKGGDISIWLHIIASLLPQFSNLILLKYFPACYGLLRKAIQMEIQKIKPPNKHASMPIDVSTSSSSVHSMIILTAGLGAKKCNQLAGHLIPYKRLRLRKQPLSIASTTCSTRTIDRH